MDPHLWRRAALALLFARERRVRAGGATLVAAWFLLSIGTALTNTFDLRYVAQVAPLAWIGGTAGTALLVRRGMAELRARRERQVSPAA